MTGNEDYMNDLREAFGADAVTEASDAPAVGTHTQEPGEAQKVTPQPGDDRLDVEHEPERIPLHEWREARYYAVTGTADDGSAEHHKARTAYHYEEYVNIRDYFHEEGYYITGEHPQTAAEYFPGLFTADAAIAELEADKGDYLKLRSFPRFSSMAQIRPHDTVIIAADNGGGKSSLALNFIDDLNDDYPIIYFNMENGARIVTRRLISIHSGIELDEIKRNYHTDAGTRERVNKALRELANRRRLQILEREGRNLEDRPGCPGMESYIASATAAEPDPTIVIIDHALLTHLNKESTSNFERFTAISERLRNISEDYNIIMFVLVQQNRAGKERDDEGRVKQRPTNNSLKGTGSWESDATHVAFLWEDPDNDNRKTLIMTKNRDGETFDEVLDYNPKTQKYSEPDADGKLTARFDTYTPNLITPTARTKPQKKADLKRQKILDAIERVKAQHPGTPATLQEIARDCNVTVNTLKSWLKDIGDFTINGEHITPAGISDIIEPAPKTLTPAEEKEAGVTDAFSDAND